MGSGETWDLVHDMGHEYLQEAEPYQDEINGTQKRVKGLRASLKDDTKEVDMKCTAKAGLMKKGQRLCSSRKRDESG